MSLKQIAFAVLTLACATVRGTLSPSNSASSPT
jgi:hypothetical protein